MSRCGIDTAEYIEDEDFMPVFDFNTPDAVNMLGTGVSQLSEQVLREVEVTIKKHERQHSAERSSTHEQLDIPPARRLFHSEPDTTGAAGRADGQIRPDAPDVSTEQPANIVQFPVSERETVPTSVGDRPNRQHETPAVDDRTRAAEPTAGQSDRSDGLGGSHEQSPTASGRTDISGADLQLTKHFSLDDNGLQDLLSHTSLESLEVDNILRTAGNQNNSDMRVALKYAHDLSPDEISPFLREEYRTGGKGFQMGTKHIAAWWDRDGLLIGSGKSVLQSNDRVFLTWAQVESRIRSLIETGEYISSERLEQAADTELHRLADMLIFSYRDDMRGICEMPEEWQEDGSLFPAITEKVASLLSVPETRDKIISTLQADNEVLKSRSDERSWHLHDVDKLLSDLQEWQRPIVDISQAQDQSIPANSSSVT